METTSSPRRGADRAFLSRLPGEVSWWQQRGIITPQQGDAIIGSYESVASAERASSYGRLVTILGVLGAVLTGLGVILFFAANWDEIPRYVKIALMVVTLGVTYGIGYWLRYKRGYRRVGMATIFLGALVYGAAIHLIAQAYHVPVNDPNLMLFWFLGVFPLAYAVRSQSLLFLGLGLFALAIGFRLPEWVRDFDSGALLAAAGLYLLIGLLAYGLGRLHGMFRGGRVYATVYEIAGLLATFGALWFLAFRAWYEEWRFDQGHLADLAPAFWVAFGVITALAAAAFVAALVKAGKSKQPQGTLPFEALAALALAGTAYLVVFLPGGDDILYPLLFNGLLLAGIIGLAVVGYLQEKEALINLAVLFFSVDVITRYFEFSWGLADRSIVFIGAGILLLAGGFVLERARRQVLTQLHESEEGA